MTRPATPARLRAMARQIRRAARAPDVLPQVYAARGVEPKVDERESPLAPLAWAARRLARDDRAELMRLVGQLSRANETETETTTDSPEGPIE